jgi:DNA-binding HxlR family transcriptional regulator
MMADNGNVISGGTSAPGCPLDPVLSLLAHKWLAHIVWFLGHAESLRFAKLQRRLPGNISAKVLSARLKELEALNMLAREDKGTTPPHVEYRLTPYGRSIYDLLEDLELKARGLALPVISQALLHEEASGL